MDLAGCHISQLAHVDKEVILGQPSAAKLPTGSAISADLPRVTPNITVVVGHPAAAAIVDARGHRAVDAQPLEKIEQRFMALGQIGHFSRPVVHLRAELPTM